MNDMRGGNRGVVLPCESVGDYFSIKEFQFVLCLQPFAFKYSTAGCEVQQVQVSVVSQFDTRLDVHTMCPSTHIHGYYIYVQTGYKSAT